MKILIVDDKLENRVLLRYMVKKQGHDTLEASDGLEACKLFEQPNNIDLILMDVMMPIMDGFKTTQKIKELASGHHVAVIFVTALDDTETLNRCLFCGGDDFIAKPVNSVVLHAKLVAHQRVIDLHRQLESQNQQLLLHETQTKNDHFIVEKMFQQAMKRNALDLQGFHYNLSPLSLFNGDVLLVTEHPERGVYLFVGDFTGHGLTAAMGSLPVSEIFFAMTHKGLSIGEIAAEMDSHLRELLPVTMFCCAVLLNLDKSRRQLTAWIGGMDSFFIIGSDGKIRKETSEHHLPLGVHWGNGFDRSVLQLDMQEGDRIFCFTDGVTEATNAEGNMFGIERLYEYACSNSQVHVKNIIEKIRLFCGDAAQRDDITVAELVCESPASLSASDTEDFINEQKDSASTLRLITPLTNKKTQRTPNRFH